MYSDAVESFIKWAEVKDQTYALIFDIYFIDLVHMCSKDENKLCADGTVCVYHWKNLLSLLIINCSIYWNGKIVTALITSEYMTRA